MRGICREAAPDERVVPSLQCGPEAAVLSPEQHGVLERLAVLRLPRMRPPQPVHRVEPRVQRLALLPLAWPQEVGARVGNCALRQFFAGGGEARCVVPRGGPWQPREQRPQREACERDADVHGLAPSLPQRLFDQALTPKRSKVLAENVATPKRKVLDAAKTPKRKVLGNATNVSLLTV